MDPQKTRVFITRVEGVEPKARMVSAKGAKLLKDFILDPEMREKILTAYLNDDVTLNTAEVEQPNVDEMFAGLENENNEQEEQTTSTDEHIRSSIAEIINDTLAGVKHTMRPIDEIVNYLFYVIDTQSINSLDSVGLYLNRAFTNLYKENPTIVDKFVAFNLLVTKYEAYLKKLYYLMKGEEVKPMNEGEEVTWSNVIHDVRPLWQLKYSQDDSKQLLYQWLLLVKQWRNSESHISPTSSEAEVDAAIKIIITMYCYATGSCITDLEMAGHDAEAQPESHVIHMNPVQYEDYESIIPMAAEDE